MIVALAAGLVVITAIIATFVDIIDWFTHRHTLYFSDADNVAFTLAKHWEDGNYNTVQGVFNTRGKHIVDGRNLHSQNVDQDLANAHRGKRMAVYTD